MKAGLSLGFSTIHDCFFPYLGRGTLVHNICVTQ